MQPLTYSRFSHYKLVDEDVESAPVETFPFSDGAKFRGVGVINQPACQVVFEDFLPGADFAWTCWHDEVHFVTHGRAEITYYEPPMFEGSGKILAEPGSLYLVPRGTRMEWTVLEGPFRRFTVDFPNPGFPLNEPPSVAAGV